MGNNQTKADITPEQYAEYMKLKQQAEYQKQLAISKTNQRANQYRQPSQFRPPDNYQQQHTSNQPPNNSNQVPNNNYQQSQNNYQQSDRINSQ